MRYLAIKKCQVKHWNYGSYCVQCWCLEMLGKPTKIRWLVTHPNSSCVRKRICLSMNSMILEMTHGFGKCFYAKWPEKRIIYSIPWQYHDTLLVAVGHLCKHCKFKYWSHISHIMCHSHRILLICSPHIHRLGHFGSSSNSEDTKVFKTTNQFNDTKNLRYPPSFHHFTTPPV